MENMPFQKNIKRTKREEGIGNTSKTHPHKSFISTILIKKKKKWYDVNCRQHIPKASVFPVVQDLA